MLELRPICEQCAKPLRPESLEARICSFECTFCRDCVEQVLGNVCPNCGGGFSARPVRPARDWKGGNSLVKYPPGGKPKHRPIDPAAHAQLRAAIGSLSPEKR